MDNTTNIDFAHLTPAQYALLAQIRTALATNPLAVERAITVLFAEQTRDEQATSRTCHQNSRGFNSADASRGSYYARWIAGGRHLDTWHLTKARVLVAKYWRQLLRAAVAKQSALRAA